MKNTLVSNKLSFAVFATAMLFLGGFDAFGQAARDFRSSATGNWNATTTWQTNNGATWVAANTTPTSADGQINIQSNFTVTVTAAVTADQVVVRSGSTLTMAVAGGITLNDGTGTDLDIFGTVSQTSATALSIGGSPQIVIENGGTVSSSTKALLNITSTGSPSITISNGGSLSLLNNSAMMLASSGSPSISVLSGGVLTLGGSAVVISTAGTPSITVAGTMNFNATKTQLQVTGGTLTLTVTNGGVVDDKSTGNSWNVNGAGTLSVLVRSNGTIISEVSASAPVPTATWSDGSLFVVSNSSLSTVGFNQSFSSLSFNYPSAAASIDAQSGNITVRSNLSIVDFNGKGVRIPGTGNTLNAYNISVSNSILNFQSAAGAPATVNITNNLTVSSGASSLDVSGSPTTPVQINFTGGGSHTFSQGGTISDATRYAWAVTSGDALTLSGGNVTISSPSTFTNSGTLTLGTQSITGTGVFSATSGSTTKLGAATGIGTGGNIASTGGNTFDAAANFEFNGSVAQVSGASFPATVNNLTINNTGAQVQLSGAETVNGTLAMTTGVLDLNAKAVSVAALSGTGTISNGTGSATLTVNNSSAASFGGVIKAGGGTLALTKTGTDTFTLSAANTYTGGTVISNGVLKLTGSGSLASSSIAVSGASGTFDVSTVTGGFTLGSGQQLSGIGVVTGAVTVASGGLISPGNSPGTLTFTNDLTLNASSTNYFDLTNSTDIGGGTNDLIVVQGNLTPNSSVIAITVANAGALAPGTYRLINYNGTLSGHFNTTPVFLSGSAGGSASIDDSVAGQINLKVVGVAGLAFVQQPSDAVAGVNVSPSVTVIATNSDGSPFVGAGVVMSLGSGSGTLSGTLTQVTDGTGTATFTNLSVNLVGTKTLHAVSGVQTADSASFNISYASASKLAMQTQPSTTAQAGVAFAQPAVVVVQDQFGNTVSNSTVSITATASSGNLGGTTTVAANGSNGTATFTDLYATNVATFTIDFTSSPLTHVVSSSVTDSAGPAAQLLITTAIASPQTDGANFTPSPVVKVYDQYANLTSSNAVVTASLSSTDGSGSLAGTQTSTAASGVATFSALKFALGDPAVSENVVVYFTSSGLVSATNASVLVNPSLGLAITQQPTDTAAGANVSPNVTVLVTNSNTGANVPGITVTVSKIAGSGTLYGTLTQVSDGSGVATFTNLSFHVAGSGKQLQATAGIATASSSTFTVNAGSFTALQVLAPGESNAPDTGSGKSGTASGQHLSTAFNVTVNAVDSYYNVVTTAPTDSISVTTSDAADTEPAPANLASGTQTFSITPATLGSDTITATNNSNVAVANGTAAVTVYHQFPYFKSVANANYTNFTTWQQSTDDGATWSAATAYPQAANSDRIEITTNTVSLTNAVTVDDMIIDATGVLKNQTGSVLTLAHKTGATVDLDVFGTNQFTANVPMTVNSGAVQKFENGGYFLWQSTTAAQIPTSTWDTNSTCLIAPTSAAAAATPVGANQAFGNFVWNWPTQTGTAIMGNNFTNGMLTNILGDFELNCGTAGGFCFGPKPDTNSANGGNFTITIGGAMKIHNVGLNLSLGSGGTARGAYLYKLGKGIIMDSGVVGEVQKIDAGNPGITAGAGMTFEFTGNAEYTLGTNVLANPTNALWLVDSGATLTLNSAVAVTARPFTVNGTLDSGTNVISGSGTFSNAVGSTLKIGSSAGITASGATGNIQTTTRSFSTGGNYIYTGSSAQVLGSGLPTTVNNLTLANNMTNSVTVTNTVSSSTPSYTVSGTLTANNAVIAYTVQGAALKRGSYALFNYSTLSGLFNATPVLAGGSAVATPTVSSDGAHVNLVVPNTVPVAVTDTFSRASGVALKIKISDLLANDTDVDGDTISFVGVSATTNGATLSNSNGYLLVPANTVADAFTYTIQDGNLGTNSGTVLVSLAGTSAGQQASITVSGGTATLTFFGIPSVTYHIQVATDLSGGGNWSNVTTATADASTGVINYTDSSAPNGQAYYRIVYP